MSSVSAPAALYAEHKAQMSSLAVLSLDDVPHRIAGPQAVSAEWTAIRDELVAADLTHPVVEESAAETKLALAAPARLATEKAHAAAPAAAKLERLALAPLKAGDTAAVAADKIDFEPRFSEMFLLLEAWWDANHANAERVFDLKYVIDFLFTSMRFAIHLPRPRLEELFDFASEKGSRPALERLNFWLKDNVDPLQHWVHFDRIGARSAESFKLYPTLSLHAPVARRTIFFGALEDRRILYFTARQDSDWFSLDPHYTQHGKLLPPTHYEDPAIRRVAHARGWLLEPPPPRHPAAGVLGIERGDVAQTRSDSQELFLQRVPGEQISLPLFALKLHLSVARRVTLSDALRIETVLKPDDDIAATGGQPSVRTHGALINTQVGMGLFLEPLRPSHRGTQMPSAFFKPASAYSQAVTPLNHDMLGELAELGAWGAEVAEEMRRAGSWSSL